MYNYDLKNVSDGVLMTLFNDATNRIGTHVAGSREDINENYIKEQENIIDKIQIEVERRSKKH